MALSGTPYRARIDLIQENPIPRDMFACRLQYCSAMRNKCLLSLHLGWDLGLGTGSWEGGETSLQIA